MAKAAVEAYADLCAMMAGLRAGGLSLQTIADELNRQCHATRRGKPWNPVQVSGLCVRTGEVLRCDDGETDERVNREACRRVGLRSMIVVPLYHQRVVVGVLKVLSSQVAAFGDRDLQVLQLMAGLIAAAMSRAAAFEAEQALVAERTRALQDTHESLRVTEDRYRSVVEGSLQGIMIKKGPRIEHVNPACARMFGYDSPEELIGRPWEIIVAPEELSVLWQRAEACEQGETLPPHPGWQGVRKDGKRIWLESMVSPISWQGDTAVLTFIVDVSERKQLESQLRQAQKMEAVGQLAGGVAHDFNNLLTIITGYGEIVLGSLPAGDPTRELIKEITRAGERAATLTRQLLIFSRQQVVEPKILDLNAIVGDTEKMLRRLIGEDVRLGSRLDPQLDHVKADAGHMEQILLNLAVNARDAMPQGGDLTIETSTTDLDESYTRLHADARPGRYVLLSVSDTGCGMNDATKARIFEPFFTTKEPGKGTGLGLATVFGIVKQCGGHIGVYSEVGHGTVFKVYLPAVEAKRITSTSQPSLRTSPRGSETILLVEDEDAVRALTRHALAILGYSVLEASRGDEAIRLCANRTGTIDLVVSDVVMPGMGGRQLVERLTQMRPRMKVLYLSGYTADAIVRHGVLQAENAFLQKPFTPSALAEKVRAVLDAVPAIELSARRNGSQRASAFA